MPMCEWRAALSMAEASWLVAPRHVPAQTGPVESCQQYAVQNPQITMGPINNHLVSSYFISGLQLSRAKFPWNIYKTALFFYRVMTKRFLNSAIFVFSFSKMQECVIVLMMRCIPDHLYSILWAACVQNISQWAQWRTDMNVRWACLPWIPHEIWGILKSFATISTQAWRSTLLIYWCFGTWS